MLDEEERRKRIAEIVEELRVLSLRKSSLGFELGPYWDLRDMIPLLEDKIRRTHQFAEEELPDHKGRMLHVAGIIGVDLSQEAKDKRRVMFAQLDHIRNGMRVFKEAKHEYDWIKDRIKLLQAMIEKVRMAAKPKKLPKPKFRPRIVRSEDNGYEY